MHSHGRENRTLKFIPISPARNKPACDGESSPVVNGLAFVRSTCLSISLSQKSLIIQPADLQDKAPTVNKETVAIDGIMVVEPKANPQ